MTTTMRRLLNVFAGVLSLLWLATPALSQTTEDPFGPCRYPAMVSKVKEGIAAWVQTVPGFKPLFGSQNTILSRIEGIETTSSDGTRFQCVGHFSNVNAKLYPNIRFEIPKLRWVIIKEDASLQLEQYNDLYSIEDMQADEDKLVEVGALIKIDGIDWVSWMNERQRAAAARANEPAPRSGVEAVLDAQSRYNDAVDAELKSRGIDTDEIKRQTENECRRSPSLCQARSNYELARSRWSSLLEQALLRAGVDSYERARTRQQIKSEVERAISSCPPRGSESFYNCAISVYEGAAGRL